MSDLGAGPKRMFLRPGRRESKTQLGRAHASPQLEEKISTKSEEDQKMIVAEVNGVRILR